MIHHVPLGTNDPARARAFYDAVPGVLGPRSIVRDGSGAHYGTGDIRFSVVRPADGDPAAPGNGVRVAFVARDRAMVRAFHRAALDHGGTEDDAPGLRPDHDAHDYAAFVRDPDGNRVEAVTMAAD